MTDFRFNFAGGAEIIVTTVPKEEIVLPDNVALLMPTQTHTDNVALADGTVKEFPDTDGLVSMTPSIAVGVRTADCVPILFYASDIGAVAATHAGWKGTLAGIGQKTADLLLNGGASPGNIHVFISVAICGRCYEVSEDLEQTFRDKGHGAGVEPRHLDLKEINRHALMRRGIPDKNITVSEICTLHSLDENDRQLFPSWRRNPGVKDRLISAIRLLK